MVIYLGVHHAQAKRQYLFMYRYFMEPKAAESAPGPLEHGNPELESCPGPKDFLSVTLSCWDFMASGLSPLLLDLLGRQHSSPLFAHMNQNWPLHKGRLESWRYMFSLAATLTSILNVNSKVPEKRILFQGFTLSPSAMAKYGCYVKKAGLGKMEINHGMGRYTKRWSLSSKSQRILAPCDKWM